MLVADNNLKSGVWRVLLLVVVAVAVLTTGRAQAEAATTDDAPVSTTAAEQVEDEPPGTSMVTRLKAVLVIAVIPGGFGLMAFGAKRLRGDRSKEPRRKATSAPGPTRRSRSLAVAAPPSRMSSRSGMRQVKRLKRN